MTPESLNDMLQSLVNGGHLTIDLAKALLSDYGLAAMRQGLISTQDVPHFAHINDLYEDMRNSLASRQLPLLKKALEKFSTSSFQVFPKSMGKVINMIDEKESSDDILDALREIAEAETKAYSQPNLFRSHSDGTIAAYSIIHEFFLKNCCANRRAIMLPSLIESLNAVDNQRHSTSRGVFK